MNFIGAGKSRAPIKRCPMHTHEHWEIIYQIDAHTIATVAGIEFPMSGGDLIIIPPMTPHNTVSDVAFSDMNIRLKKCDFPTSPFVLSDIDGSILKFFEIIYSAHLDRSGFSEIITEKLSELICLYIKKTALEANEPKAVSEFKLLLRENVANADFELTTELKKYGYNPDYLRRSFKKHASLSPLSYLNKLRIEKAKELLLHERFLSVDEVASRCGFNDSFYFSTSFKRQVGVSPLAFRKSNK